MMTPGTTRIASDEEVRRDRWTLLGMMFSSILCLVSSFVLSADAVKLAANPSTVLSCDINSVISCGKVAETWQAHVLGFPNAFLGLICEPVIILLTLSMMLRMRFPRWFMISANVVYLCGLVFALWLFSQSLLVIHAFCPWCILVSIGTLITFFSLTRLNILSGYLMNIDRPFGEFVTMLIRNKVDVAVAFLLVVLMLGTAFVSYGPQLLS